MLGKNYFKCTRFFLPCLTVIPPPKKYSPLQDARIEGGYEAVPTRDIHMKQVGLEETWLEFLRLYVKDLVEQQFIGYNSDVKKSIIILCGIQREVEEFLF